MTTNRQNDEVEKEKAQREWLENYIKTVEKTDQNIFRVGDYDFEPIFDEANSPSKSKYELKVSRWYIAELSRKFHCEIHAYTTQIDALKKEEVLSSHNSDGLLKIEFDFQGLHQNGFPKAEINVVDGRIEHGQYYGFSISKHHYQNWKFFGKIFIDEKGVKIFGNFDSSPFRSPTFETTNYPINIQIAFDVEDLNWSEYGFTTLEELATASPKLVKSIVLEGSDSIETIPESFRDYKNLTTLSLGFMNTRNIQKSLTVIPDWIGELENLENLSISGPKLEELPRTIAKLQKLKRIDIFNTKLQSIPSGIWQLPHLEHLNLSSNQLTEMPFGINLPNLKSLSFKSNQLTRLVAEYNLPNLELLNFEDNQLDYLLTSFAQLPKLKHLYLRENLLKSLSESFGQIEHLDVEIELKNQFLDFEYKGADGKGTVAWDDKVFYAQYDTELMQSIEAYWNKELTQTYRDDLSQLMKKSIGLSLGEKEMYQQLGNHRIGGMPDLPKTMSYPRFGENWREDKKDYIYEFIAQINCTDIAHLQDYLPKTGMLYFFLSTIDDVYNSSNAAKVIHLDNEVETLQSGKDFNFTKEDYSEAYEDVAYSGYQASVQKFVDLPDFYPIRQNEYMLETLSEAFRKEIKEVPDSGYSFTEAFGTFVKSAVAVNGYGFSQNEYPEHEVALVHKGKPQDWIILLRVPSVGSFQWGDAGDLFFVIHKSDLAKQDFSNVICTMYSS